MREVLLCNLPFLDINYDNVIDFSSEKGRDDYFRNKAINTITSQTKFDYNKQTLTIPVSVHNINTVDYIVIKDKGRSTFYFVLKKETLNEAHTILHLKLDTWTTYMFSYKLLPSYVERCHERRYLNGVNQNIIDEGLPLGDYIVDEVETIKEYENGLLIATTQPLGVVDNWERPNYTTPSTPNTDLTNIPLYTSNMELERLTFNDTPSKGTTLIYGGYILETETTNIHSGNYYYKDINVYYRNNIIYNIRLENDDEKYTKYYEGGLAKENNRLYIVTRSVNGGEHKIVIF